MIPAIKSRACSFTRRPHGSGTRFGAGLGAGQRGQFDVVRRQGAGVECHPEYGPITVQDGTFSFERDLPNGRVMTMTGTVASTPSPEDPLVRDVALQMTREVRDASAVVLRSMTMSGQLHVVEGADPAAPSRTMSGAMHATFADGAVGDMTMDGVVRVPSTTCAWPIAGTITRVDRNAVTHVLGFGPECGDGTLDGEPVDLAALPRHGHGVSN